MRTMKKLTLLAGMALAVAALAVPASASADQFTVEALPLEGEETAEVEFSGPFRYEFWSEQGVDCEKATFDLLVKATSATYTDAQFTGCKSVPDNFPVDVTPVDLEAWTASPDVEGEKIVTDNFALHSDVKNPITEEVQAQHEVEAEALNWEIDELQLANIEEVDVESEGAIYDFGSGPFYGFPITGSLSTDFQEELGIE